MAPIDCTGVPSSAGLKWFCKHCCTVHRDKVWFLQLIIRKPTICWSGFSWSADTITTITTQSSPSPTPVNLMASHLYWSPLMVAFSARRVEFSIYNKLSLQKNFTASNSFYFLLFTFLLQVPVNKYTRFGPLVGKIVKENSLDFDEDRKKVFITYTQLGAK